MTRTFTALAIAAVAAFGPSPAAADVVSDWNAIMVSTVGGQNPFAQARFAAIVQLAVFDAVNAVAREYTPYLRTLDAPPGASPEAAAIAAAHDVLAFYFPASAGTLAAARASSLAAIPDGPSKNDGIAIGAAAAAAMIALRANDGSAPPQFYLPPTAEPGEWQPTAACPPAGGLLLHWRNVSPFGLKSSWQFRSTPPPPLDSGRYARSYEEVRKVGAADSVRRPVDRADVAQFYNANLAVRVWNDVARQLAASQPMPLAAAARAFALLNMAVSDGVVTSMETKYHYRFWRPETAIPDFTPFITTPCFPSYPSAHASGSYAARTILRKIWGDRGHSIVLTHPAVPQVVLSYATLAQITDDIDDARVYGGIHFRFDQTAGATQGIGIGRYVFRKHLRPVSK